MRDELRRRSKQHDVEHGTREYQRKWRHVEHAESLDEQKEQQKAPKKKRGRWWRFFIGD